MRTTASVYDYFEALVSRGARQPEPLGVDSIIEPAALPYAEFRGASAISGILGVRPGFSRGRLLATSRHNEGGWVTARDRAKD